MDDTLTTVIEPTADQSTTYSVRSDGLAVAWVDHCGRSDGTAEITAALPVSFHWVDTGVEITGTYPGQTACEHLGDRPCRVDVGYRLGDEVAQLLDTIGPAAVLAYLTERHEENRGRA